MQKIKKCRPVLCFCALFAALLALSVIWIVVDDLFSPLGERSVSVEIPNFCGEPLTNLSYEGWMDRKIEYRYDPNTPPGVVLSQSPRAGSRRKLTAKRPTCLLTLTVSLGEETVILPDLAGTDAREAEGRLRELGFVVKISKRRGGYPDGRVIEIAPRAGTVLPRGAEVELTVSAGTPTPVTTVPDLKGLLRSEALVKLWLSQLTVAEVVEVESDLPSGSVVGQSLVPGTRVAASTKMTIYVSRARYDKNFFGKGEIE